ncbi:MAG: hypothetical protein IJJ26_05465 [Victivallales bacterium]|nr:hypothetical protein [Victivallales bacterium]
MLQTTLGIEGMMCGMCEAHMNDLVRKLYPDIKKVSSSSSKKQTIILSEQELDKDKLQQASSSIGYTMTSFHSAPYVKTSFLQRLFGIH